MTRRLSRPRTALRVLAAPLLLLAASCAGLILALTGDGWSDAIAALLLAAPILALARSMRA